MKLKCLNCGYEFYGTISYDALGWHSSCPECEGSFDVDVSEEKEFYNDLLMEQREQM